MAFLNKKERVIDIKFTPHGETLFSQGKFNPVYYSFEDDHVLYDAEYAKKLEVQNDIQDRVFEDLNLGAVNIVGAETNRSKVENFKFADEDYHLTLGSQKSNSEYSPAWNIQLLHGDRFEEGVEFLTGSSAFINVPRLTVKTIYKTFIDQETVTNKEESPYRVLNAGMSKKYSDGTFINVEEGYILLKIEEFNTNFENENFEIELFKMNTSEDAASSGSYTELEALDFNEKRTTTVEKMLGASEKGNLASGDSSYAGKSQARTETDRVNYFFEVLVDEEIPSDIACEFILNNKKKGIYADKMTTACQKTKGGKVGDTYITRVFDTEECKK